MRIVTRLRCVAQSVGSHLKNNPSHRQLRPECKREVFFLEDGPMWRGAYVLVWLVGHVATLRNCRLPRAPGRVTPGRRHETG